MKKMNQLKSTLTVILLLVFTNIGQSQNCYEVIADLSGFDTSPYQAELDIAACELRNAFPAEFQNQFKVYDFGFYSQNEFMQGGFQAVWDKVVSEIPTDYYLIFGKQTDQTGIYTKFWVDIKLPSSSIFVCTDETTLTSLVHEVRSFTELKYSQSARNPSSYPEAEIFGLNRLKTYIQNQEECCDTGQRRISSQCGACLTIAETKSILNFEGYESYDGYELISYNPISTSTDLFENNGSTTIKKGSDNLDLHSELSQLSVQLNEFFTPIKIRLNYIDALSCPTATLFSGDKRGEQFAFIDVFAIDDGEGNITLKSKVYSGIQQNQEDSKILILKAGGTNTNDAQLKTELSNFLNIGGCNPEIIVSDKVPYPNYKAGDRLIVIGNDRCDIQESFNCCHAPNNNAYKNYISSAFFGEITYSWIKNPKDWEIVDNYMWRSAVIDVSSIDVDKINSGNINKGAAFITYHALGHMATHLGHNGTFTPLTGFMSTGTGVFHILGTENANKNPELFDIYNSLENMINDANNNFNGKSQTYIDKICELF